MEDVSDIFNTQIEARATSFPVEVSKYAASEEEISRLGEIMRSRDSVVCGGETRFKITDLQVDRDLIDPSVTAKLSVHET